jgi:dUTP pyrophosphatase
VPGGKATLVPTGLAFALPPGSVGIIKSRSSLAAKHDVEAGAGVIDADYRGEVSVLLRNFGDQPLAIAAGQRIAQLVVFPLAPLLDTPAEETLEQLGETQRGAGGFGSTGM